jgi:hypothetical protein
LPGAGRVAKGRLARALSPKRRAARLRRDSRKNGQNSQVHGKFSGKTGALALCRYRKTTVWRVASQLK